MKQQKLLQYENGLRVIVDSVPNVKSVAAGFWVHVGSSFESLAINGLSHFTEHMLFKGTDKMSASQIADAFESYGANVNAFTGKECTCYYAKTIDEYKENVFELLAHIFFDSIFDEGELDKERNVILEEINMVEDSPEDICYELLAKSLYGESVLGQTILGPTSNIKRFKKKDVDNFIGQYYCAERVVISLSGAITLKEADAYVKKFVFPKICVKTTGIKSATKIKIAKKHVERVKDFEQSNIAISYAGLPFNDKRASVLNVLNILLGGSMSSRLFQSIRERMGLAYSVYSAPSAYRHNGSLNIVMNISVDNTQKALDAVKTELQKILKGDIKTEEIIRAKTQLKSALIFSGESTQSIMTANGKLLCVTDEVYDVNKKIKEIDAVSLEEVNQLASDIFKDGHCCTAYVGKEHKADFGGFSIG